MTKTRFGFEQPIADRIGEKDVGIINIIVVGVILFGMGAFLYFSGMRAWGALAALLSR